MDIVSKSKQNKISVLFLKQNWTWKVAHILLSSTFTWLY